MKGFRFIFCAIIFLVVIAGATERNLLDNTQIISKITTTQKVVALTIDDGPHNKVTPEILAILRDKHVKATFFVLGVNVEKFPQILAQEVTDGHEIGLHTYSHPLLTNLSKNRITEEFEKAEKVILPMVSKPTLFRPPGGSYNSQVLEVAHQRGYRAILWSIDTRDWSCPPNPQIIDTIFKEIKPGSIILMHDGQYPIPTPQVLSTIIDGLRERGYEFVTVSELLQYNEVRHSVQFLD